MTENLIQKLEEKVMILVTELEGSRKELQQLRLETTNLQNEKANHAKKLQALISLMDAVDVLDQSIAANGLDVLQARKEPVEALA